MRSLFERYACFRPLNRVVAWLSDQGLTVSSRTLGDSAHRFTPLFEPMAGAILARQNDAAVRHGDEKAWRVFVYSINRQGINEPVVIRSTAQPQESRFQMPEAPRFFSQPVKVQCGGEFHLVSGGFV